MLSYLWLKVESIQSRNKFADALQVQVYSWSIDASCSDDPYQQKAHGSLMHNNYLWATHAHNYMMIVQYIYAGEIYLDMYYK